MIRKLFISIFACCACLSSMAQAQQEQRIAITPLVSDELDIPEGARKALSQRLLQMTTQNGFGATEGAFTLTANVLTTDKQVTTNYPPQFVVALDVSVYVVNLTENLVVAEMTFPVRGTDANENKAIIRAINRINARTPEVRKFMTTAREKIIDYYATRVPAILTKAQSLADRGEHEQALAELAAVPECLDDYPMVAEKMNAIYVQMVDKYAAISIRDAKSKMATHDYKAALESLFYVSPASNLFGESTKLVDEITKTIDEREKAALERELNELQAQREMALKIHNDEVALRKLQIEASMKRDERIASENRRARDLNIWIRNL